MELYLDGQLQRERLAEVERRIATEPALRAIVEQQAQLDQLLGQWAKSPAANPAFIEQLAASGLGEGGPSDGAAGHEAQPAPLTVRPRQSPSPWRQRGLAAAAVLACTMTWVFFGWDQLKSLVAPENEYGHTTVAQMYQREVQSGFEPNWVCEDDQEFAQTFHERQGIGLLLKPLPEGVRMAGLAYREGFTEQATCMLAYVGEQPVLVIAARESQVADRLLENNAEQQLSIFTRPLGELMLVEVSPLDRPRLLEFLYQAEVPAAPTGRVPGAPRSEN